MRKRAFTLIELLVVIAIIAILAAILFPVFAKAREKARQSSCQSNLKQLAIAVQQYINDYDERVPRAAGYVLPDLVITQWGYGEWYYMLDPYVKNKQLWDDPSAGNTGVYSGAAALTTDPLTGARLPDVEYGRNGRVANAMLATIAAPSTTVLQSDGRNNYFRWLCPNTGASTACEKTGTTLTNYAWSFNRHNEGANYSFLDGHVKWSMETITANGPWTRPDMQADIVYHP